ncbi:DUF1778 domain-containing protein [Asticcacaulis sp. EMRT-3]|uniref:type II toxin-antitoxin system TacA family antitoxin n=1 Tax=Asticcacaulis sp. EMRT-3 TaxID=3040349 RepID=UPI0024AFA35B|nr:DUF1778 domain-containing protein [Asticcacaulis sp. EMRT-3]MDI7774148.1 DUF1778 domain-containing protein [Asticcacaulis sp. EMRT-3]
MPDDARAKTARIDLRMSPAAKSLLEQAARARHKTVSEFVLDQSLSAAEETLADRRLFLLDDAQWAEFNRLLDAPPQDNPGLRQLAAIKPRWAD